MNLNNYTKLALLTLVFVGALQLFMPLALAQGCPANQQPCNNRCIPVNSLCILEPVPGGVDEIPAGGFGLSAFFYYINNGVWQWIFGIGIAIAVMNGVIGGLQISLSYGDSGKIGEGKTRFISSAVGLAILLLTGVILAFLNPVGFVNV